MAKKFKALKMKRVNSDTMIDEVGQEHLIAAIKKLMQDGYPCVQVTRPLHGKGYRVRGHRWESHGVSREEVMLEK